ncbi:Phosphoribosylaminoimidazole synthetase [Ignavibacterium album JCM 16511]|uniref:Phosphoribosylformylglycinamidine cyclo-ligase n=1 Tax=Ignavibacterium album (strain DSM 19864 / JCM 16511 / NBRC 101810 / Mat9-16) TaxID=945713 RepID=I0AIN7_IGNAJ|nr:phosphoribosylformylglycinamidine cyclo-ligase [Ignavibacterium album]AFH48844.1 Phosphoribosylaminoimidazole synthetase [Ignavibacterium album JCM 16511]
MDQTYKEAGVDIEAGEKTVDKIKAYAKSTFSKNVLSDIGLFGGFYELDLSAYRNPVLVSSVDGVGTKLKIAFEMDKHDTIGQDLVNHCVNDIAVCGAEPLFFLDYYATGKLNPDKAAKVIEGFSIACKENGCALIGGETAEMPGFYQGEEYDVSGTIVGIVDKEKIINGSKIQKGDVLIGITSNGLHTNGYSLARKVLLEKFKLDQYFDELGHTLGEELLRVHKSYLGLIKELKSKVDVKGLSHITGGGIIGNTKRIIPEGLSVNVHWGNWEMPAIFKLIMNAGNVSVEEMRNVFNLGIGLVVIVSPDHERLTFEIAHGMKEHALHIGEVV